jgi:hypothetical protein
MSPGEPARMDMSAMPRPGDDKVGADERRTRQDGIRVTLTDKIQRHRSVARRWRRQTRWRCSPPSLLRSERWTYRAPLQLRGDTPSWQRRGQPMMRVWPPGSNRRQQARVRKGRALLLLAAADGSLGRQTPPHQLRRAHRPRAHHCADEAAGACLPCRGGARRGAARRRGRRRGRPLALEERGLRCHVRSSRVRSTAMTSRTSSSTGPPAPARRRE